MLAARGRLPWLALHPLPDVRLRPWVGEDDEMFVGRFRDLMLDLATLGVVGQSPARRRGALVRHHAPLMSESCKRQGRIADRNLKRSRMAVPAEFFDEELAQIARPE